ncbi:MAG: ABC transporter ATP-binding protein [Candidatus Omnitrophica bacterium]|nr:ABC transporter ATP-binding protein [Candidatus Omnitrophota bacterium]
MSDILRIENLSVSYYAREGRLDALTGISLTLCEGGALGIVGESGCGKTTLAMSIAKLLPDNAKFISGKVIYQGKNILELTDRQLEAIRGKQIGYIFQDATAALNPVISIGGQLIETIMNSRNLSRKYAKDEAHRLLELVKIPDPKEHLEFYAHQFSGGMNQRVMIALALASRPKLLIADEPTSNLDVTIEASILELLAELRQKLGLSIIFITHDLSLVRFLADETAVIYAGKLIELKKTKELFAHPKEAYTKELLNAGMITSRL